MKRLILPFVALVMSTSLFAQNFTVTGTVTETGSGNPVANHAVYISADSTVFNYWNVVYTDVNGNYSDVIPNGAQTGPNIDFYISTDECNFMWQSFTVSNQQGTVQSATVDFQICVNGQGGGGCNATFGYIDSAGTGSIYFWPVTTSGYDYAWDFGDGNTSTQMYPVHTYAAQGIYTVCLTLIDQSTGNPVCTYCLNVSAMYNCDATFSWYQDSTNNAIWLINNSWNQSAFYSWDFGDGNTATGMYPTHVYANTGSYLVCLTVADNFMGCTDTYCDTITYVLFQGEQNRSGFTLNVVAPGGTPSGVEEIQTISEMNVYPNPVNEVLNIEFESAKATAITYEIADMLGKVVTTQNVNVTAGMNRINLSAASFDNGFYTVTLIENNHRTTVKLIKQ